MSTEENKAIHRRMYEEVWNKGNFAVLDELLANDYVYHASGPMEFKGLEEYKLVFNLLLTAFPDLNCNIEDMIAEGDKTVCRVRLHGTHKGEFWGIAPTGKQISCSEIAIIRIEDGKVAEEWGGPDMLDLIMQIGATPSEYENIQQGWNKEPFHLREN